tara:strand:+ start:876 stop:1424 length:549 start_codon:yes stop_codon:yes gene_type:complete
VSEMDSKISDPEGLSVLFHGEIDDDSAGDLLPTLLSAKEVLPKDSIINVYICSPGGCAYNMFAIYDTIRLMVQDGYDIRTHALGRAMSGGVLLLASGRKGYRTIAKNTRVMIHSIAGENLGTVNSLQSDMSEIKSIQNQFVEAMVEETNLTQRQLKRMMGRNVNIYLSAEEAVKFGIADLII